MDSELWCGYIVGKSATLSPKPCMLGTVAQIAQPTAVEWRKGDQDRQHPKSKVERETQQAET